MIKKKKESKPKFKKEWIKRAFGKGNFLGTVERTLGIWSPGPNDKADDTNPALQMAFANYVEELFGFAYSCTEREVLEPGIPNLTVLQKKTGKTYEVVTCYRSQMFIGEDGEPYLPWAMPETLDKLLAFETEHKVSIYIIIGLHGYADSPNFIFCIPLAKTSIDLKKSVLAKYEIKKNMPISFNP